MTEYERREWGHVRMCAEAHFERAMREKDGAELTRMGAIIDAHATVDPDRENFMDAFNRVVRPHLPPREQDNDLPL